MGGGPGHASTTVLKPLSQANREPGREVIFAVVTLLHAVLKPFTRRDWRNQDKVPSTGGVVFVANHISNVDPLVIGQYLAFSGRWPRFLAKASLFRVPVLGAVLRGCGQIPVQRGSAAAKDALSAAVAAVRDGRAVVVYVEGTITLDPGLWPMRGRTGAARIALQTGAPVIPLGQWGAQDIMYGKRIHFPKLLPRKTLRVLAGDPVPLDDLREEPMTGAVLAEATERILASLTALVAELRAEPPPVQRYDPRLDAPGVQP
ncbi:MAG: lysophospholipid acyltransferase family protein [Friedmanniella sp.]|jgi:1-acyl-sn-glycerol-3-phosphate acyltransferase